MYSALHKVAQGETNMTNSNLAQVNDTATAAREVAASAYEAVVHDHYEAIGIAVSDRAAQTAIDADPEAILDMNPHALTGDLGVYPRGMSNPMVKADALDWLRKNGWEPTTRTDAWRVSEPLPVRPSATDELSQVAVASSRIGQAEEARDQAIRDALAAGHSVISIAEAAGLSRARIYQIRDGRR